MKKISIYLLCTILLFNTFLFDNNIYAHASAPLVIGDALVGDSISNAIIGIACTIMGVELVTPQDDLFNRVNSTYISMPEERKGKLKNAISRGAKVGSDGNISLDSSALKEMQLLINDTLGTVSTDLSAYFMPAGTPLYFNGAYKITVDSYVFQYGSYGNNANTFIYPIVRIPNSDIVHTANNQPFTIPNSNPWWGGYYNSSGINYCSIGAVNIVPNVKTIDRAYSPTLGSAIVDSLLGNTVVLPTTPTIYNPDIVENLSVDGVNQPLTIPQYFEIVNNYYNNEYVTELGDTTYTIVDSVNPSITDNIDNEQSLLDTLPMTPTIAVPTDVKLVKGLESIFPFCVPFDVVAFFKKLDVEPTTPVFTYPLYVEGIIDYEIVIDFTMFNGLFALLRKGLVVLFIFGLILMTKPLINPER